MSRKEKYECNLLRKEKKSKLPRNEKEVAEKGKGSCREMKRKLGKGAKKKIEKKTNKC